MPPASRCSPSAAWGWLAGRCGSLRMPSAFRSALSGHPAPACWTPTLPTWRHALRRAAKTPPRCGGNCESLDSRARHGRCTADRARGAGRHRCKGYIAGVKRNPRPFPELPPAVRRRSPRQSSRLGSLREYPTNSARKKAKPSRLEQDARAATVCTLICRLAELLRDCCISSKAPCRALLTTFKAWFIDASASGAAAVTAFAAGPQQDGAEVRAGLTTPRGSGQTEGQVGKLSCSSVRPLGAPSWTCCDAGCSSPHEPRFLRKSHKTGVTLSGPLIRMK